MATFYVQEDYFGGTITGSGTRIDPWNGWNNIVWGGAGVNAGDTIVVLGRITLTGTSRLIPSNGAAGSRYVVKGEGTGAGFISSGASSYINLTGAYYLLENLVFENKDSTTGSLVYTWDGNNIEFVDCCFVDDTKIKALVQFGVGNNTLHDNVKFINCRFYNGAIGLRWLPTSTTNITSITNFECRDSVFNGQVNYGIEFRYGNASTDNATLTNILIENCTFKNIYDDTGTIHCQAIRINKTLVGRSGPQWSGIKVLNNTFQTIGSLSSGSGCIVIGCFDSLSENYGENLIVGNKAKDVYGPVGFMDIFYCDYLVIDNNQCQNIQTATQDGNGILLDYENRHVRVCRNKLTEIHGVDNKDNSGVGIMNFRSSNITMYGNYVSKARIGLWLGSTLWDSLASDVPHNLVAFYNTFEDCSVAGIWVTSTNVYAEQDIVEYNVFKGENSQYAVNNLATGTLQEKYNLYAGFSDTAGISTQSLNVSSLTLEKGVLQSPIPDFALNAYRVRNSKGGYFEQGIGYE